MHGHIQCTDKKKDKRKDKHKNAKFLWTDSRIKNNVKSIVIIFADCRHALDQGSVINSIDVAVDRDRIDKHVVNGSLCPQTGQPSASVDWLQDIRVWTGLIVIWVRRSFVLQ